MTQAPDQQIASPTPPASLPTASRSAPGAAGDVVVVAHQLTKIFRDFWMRPRARAVDGVDFEIHRGEIFGLLGPNGSGKSTTIKMMLGLLKKTSGRLAVFNKPPNDVSIKKRIGYLPEESYLYPFLNARETLDYYGKLFQLDHRTRGKRINELLDMVGLEAVQHRQVREYSKGMQRRIGLAQALINDPELLILDEPTTGLDPIGTRQVKDLIEHLGERGKTVVLSSHLLADVESVVDRMVILYGGKVRAAGTCDELLSSRTRSVIETESLDDATIAEIRAVLDRHAKRLGAVHPARERLEDLFVSLVERARAERAETSGAQHGGTTASFLRAETADGERLIDTLVAAAAEEPEPETDAVRPMDVERPAAAAAAAEPQHESVIDELVAGETEQEPAGVEPSGGEQRPIPDTGEPDDDIISSLISGDAGDAQDDDERGRGAPGGKGGGGDR